MNITDPIITDPHAVAEDGEFARPFVSSFISHMAEGIQSEILDLECRTELDQLPHGEQKQKMEQLRDARLRLRILES